MTRYIAWFILTGAALCPARAAGLEESAQQALFTAGQGGYHTYRIPSLITTGKGTLLAFCEGRKGGRGDAGNIDLLLRRSTDGGKTWGQTQVVWDDAGHTCGNPCPVIDRRSGTIWLLLTHNRGEDHESAIVAGRSKGSRTVWVSHSRDDGLTWAKPIEITRDVKKPDWTWYATGPGVGIQLRSGRLLIPCDSKSDGGKTRVARHLQRRRRRHLETGRCRRPAVQRVAGRRTGRRPGDAQHADLSLDASPPGRDQS